MDCHSRPMRHTRAMALILVIDDDGYYCGLIERELTDQGHIVVTAQNGPKGIALYIDRSPDLVITDMRMLGVDGAEVIRTLLRINLRTRIIAVSGTARHDAVDLLKLALEMGADTVVSKLDPMERLVIEVNALLKTSG